MIRWHMHDQPRLVVAVLIWNQFQPPRVRACYKPTLQHPPHLVEGELNCMMKSKWEERK